MKVYLVSTGCYSDYFVRGIYSTKELALDANRFYGNENDPEEFELDAMIEHPEGMYPYEVLMDQDGNTYKVSATGRPIERYWRVGDKTEIRPDWVPEKDNGYGHGYRTLVSQKFFTYRMWAKDEKHAVKIANERRATAIANGFAF